MATEEQTEELEVLQSIYPDELQLLTPTSFRIKLALDPPPLPGVHPTDDDEPPPALVLHVSYPEAYPSVAPNLDVTTAEGSPSSPWLEFPDDKVTLLDALSDTIEENLGMAMVFTLASTLKDAAENMMLKRATRKDQEREAQLRQEEEKEMEKFRGELVTHERFLEWRDRYRKEMEAAKRKAVEDDEAENKRFKASKAEEKKLTGKELWERGLAGNADEEDYGDETVDVSKLKLEN